MISRFNLRGLGRGLKPNAAAAVITPRPDKDTIYRGHTLEMKSLMVGWQITVAKDEAVLWHSDIAGTKDAAMADAHAHVDHLLRPGQA